MATKQKQKNKFKMVQKIKGGYLFSCPEILNLYNIEHVESSVRFINSLDNIIWRNYQQVIISFVGCRLIRGAAMMLLYAKLETILQKSDVEIVIQSSFNPIVNKQIEQAGLMYLCQHRCSKNDITQTHGGIAILNGTAGEFRDEIIDFIRRDIYQNTLTDEEEYRFGDAIQEAINNVYRHAYPIDTPEKSRPWWWMCAVFEDQLYLMLYDQGQGIPATFTQGNEYFDQIDWESEESQQTLQNLKERLGLPSKLNLSDIKKTSKLKTDSMLIALAMSDDITRIEGDDELKHGQGSKSIRKLVADNENGHLFICSNRGIFMYKDEQSKVNLYDMNVSINGTLVQWNIRIKND